MDWQTQVGVFNNLHDIQYSILSDKGRASDMVEQYILSPYHMVGCNMYVWQFSRWHVEHWYIIYSINFEYMNIFTILHFFNLNALL